MAAKEYFCKARVGTMLYERLFRNSDQVKYRAKHSDPDSPDKIIEN